MISLLNLSNIIDVHDSVRQLQTIVLSKEIMILCNKPSYLFNGQVQNVGVN